MDWFRRVKSYFVPDEGTEREAASGSESDRAGGFAQKVAVPVERPQPVISNPGYGASGGIQGLDWYKARMRMDSDGDLADEFLEESCPTSQPAASGEEAMHIQKGCVPAAKEALVLVDAGNVFIIPTDR
ncbi:hypothetical protein WJX72_010455 [[Myrmecia] bisecta]|uniref:Uncharacterized protein n=1 Tax=[Myrmecia] bisecta TaxID=41462 RepID=A0AAW1PUH4_9CHLO